MKPSNDVDNAVMTFAMSRLPVGVVPVVRVQLHRFLRMVRHEIGSVHTRFPPLGTGANEQSDQPVLVAKRP